MAIPRRMYGHCGYDPYVLLCLPWPRAVVVAVLITSLGVVGHAAAGGAQPTPTAVGVALLSATLLARAIQGRPGSLARVVWALLVGQVVVHVAMTPMHPTPSQHHMATGAAAIHTLHAGGGSPLRHSSAGAWGPQLAAWISDAVTCLLQQPTMLIMHVGAAAVVGVWLVIGEQAALRAATMIERSWLVPITALLGALDRVDLALAPQRNLVPAAGPDTPVPVLFLVPGTARRGPPLLAI